MGILKAYRFKIYPDEQQKQFFVQTFGCVRFTYNHLLMNRKQKNEMKMTPATLKLDYPFLKEIDSLALANAQRNLEKAFRRYYMGRSEYPSLKSKSSMWQSYTTNNQKHTIYFVDGKLKLPKLKTLVATNLHREVKGIIKSATISAQNNHDFFVSILCVETIDPLSKTNQQARISFCPNQLVRLSGEQQFPFSYNQLKLSEQIERAKKKAKHRARIAKKQKVALVDAKNYQKQKHKLNKLLMTQKFKKDDFIDKLSYFLVANFDVILAEVTPPTELVAAANFTRNDWQKLLAKLTYKAEWYGKTFTIGELPNTMKIDEIS